MRINHKSLRKVTEEQELNPGKMISIGIISQKDPSYGGSNNCVLIQDSDTKQKWYLFTKSKYNLTEKVTPFQRKIKTMKEMSK